MDNDEQGSDPAKRGGRAAALELLLLSLLLATAPPPAGAVDVIASSRLESCVEDGGSAVRGFVGI